MDSLFFVLFFSFLFLLLLLRFCISVVRIILLQGIFTETLYRSQIQEKKSIFVSNFVSLWHPHMEETQDQIQVKPSSDPRRHDDSDRTWTPAAFRMFRNLWTLHVIMCVWANIYLRLLILIRTHLKIYSFSHSCFNWTCPIRLCETDCWKTQKGDIKWFDVAALHAFNP